MPTWSDTAFTGINSSPDYSNWFAYGGSGETWDTSTPGQIKTTPYHSNGAALRITSPASSDTQFSKITVTSFADNFELATHVSATTAAHRLGYHVAWLPGNIIQFYRDTAYAGSATVPATPSGGGVIEWRVTAMVGTLYVAGTLVATKNFATEGVQLTGTKQSIGVGDGGGIITDAEGGDYSSAPPPQTWTRSAATVAVDGISGGWEITGGPKTWPGSPATISAVGTSAAWSVGAGTGPWFDTNFTNINASPDYSNFFVYGSLGTPEVWDTSVPGQISTTPYHGQGEALRISSPAGTLNQFVKITVTSFANAFVLATHVSGTTAALRIGYHVEWNPGNGVFFYRDGTYAGQIAAPTVPGGGGLIEWRVNAMIGTLYANGTLVTTKDFASNGAQLTGVNQAIGVHDGGGIITDASGGDFPGPKTWARSAASITVTATTGTWARAGAQTWTSTPSTSAVAVTGTSSLWAYVNPGGMRLGVAGVRALRLGSTPVVTAFMGTRRIWPPVPQTWTSSVATISTVGSSGNWYLPGMFVFSESFTAGLGHWTTNRWRNATWDNDAGHVDHCDDIAGVDGVLPPNDIVIVSNRLWIGAGSQNYGDANVRSNELFEFAGGGIIEFDTIVAPTNTLRGWSYIFITQDPYTIPSHYDYNGAGHAPKNGFSVRFNFDSDVPRFIVSNNFVETMLTPSSSNPAALTSRTNMTTIRLEFTASHIDVYANGTLWAATNWTLPPTLTEGYVYLGSHNHASVKYTGLASTNFVYGGVRWDGAVRTPTRVSRAPDAQVPHGSGMDIGYYLPTPTLTLPAVAAGVTAARLVLSSWVDPNLNSSALRLDYQFNGGPVRQTPFEPTIGPPYVGTRSLSIPINVADLVTGNNTVTISGTGLETGYHPYVGNIQLVYYAP